MINRTQFYSLAAFAAALLIALIQCTQANAVAPRTRTMIINIRPPTPETRNREVTVIGATDNQDGTTTSTVWACGGQVETIYNNKWVKTHFEQMKKEIFKALDQCCDPSAASY